MKKLFLILAAVGVMSFSAVNVYAQEATTTTEATEQTTDETVAADDTVAVTETEEVEMMKRKTIVPLLALVTVLGSCSGADSASSSSA